GGSTRAGAAVGRLRAVAEVVAVWRVPFPADDDQAVSVVDGAGDAGEGSGHPLASRDLPRAPRAEIVLHAHDQHRRLHHPIQRATGAGPLQREADSPAVLPGWRSLHRLRPSLADHALGRLLRMPALASVASFMAWQ